MSEALDDSTRFLVGIVDCADDRPGGGKSICDRFAVDELPTIRYFLPGDPTGDIYGGEQDADSFTDFARRLSGACVVSRLDGCTEAQRAELKDYLSMPITRLRTRVEQHLQAERTLRAKIAKAQEDGRLLDGEEQTPKKKTKKATMKAMAKLEETISTSLSALKALEEEEGDDYRRAKSVLLFRSPEQHATASGSVPWSTARRRFEAESRVKEQQQQQQQQRQPSLDVEEKKELKADERQVKDEV